MDDMKHVNGEHDGKGTRHEPPMMNMKSLKFRFWISLVLTVPIILMSPMMGMKLPFQFFFEGSDYLVAVIGTVLFLVGGQPFFSEARGELHKKKPAMMTLISMGILVAYVYSLYAIIANNIFQVTPMITNFFWELATLIDIMLLGHWIEMNAVMSAGSDVNHLAKLIPKQAHLVDHDSIIDIDVAKLKMDQILEVRAGEQIPADGVIIDGQTSVNESLITGESKEIRKGKNDKVIGGALNGNGTFRFKISKVGWDSYLFQIMDLVQSAQTNKSKLENRADKVAGYLFYAALFVSILSFSIWLFLSDLTVALPIAVTVLVIACPHALGLAIPLVTARSTSIAATNGLLIRNKTVLEKINKLKYVLLDKTGTLTEGKFTVTALISLSEDFTDDEITKILAGLESSATHPLATGILDFAKKKEITAAHTENTAQIVGVGLKGTIDGNEYQIASSGYLDRNEISYDRDQFKTLANDGNTVSFLLTKSKVIGLVAEADEIKSTAKETISSLKSLGIIPVMLTGDNIMAAKTVGHNLGIEKIKAGLLPEEKQKAVTDFEKHGFSMLVGDGVNDAPSLAKASIGVAIGSGTDIAIDSADVVLVNSNPEAIITLIELEKATNRKMIQNLWWGAGYNILAIPLAAEILAPIGFMLNPMVGAAVMSLSTIIVAINALTLKIK